MGSSKQAAQKSGISSGGGGGTFIFKRIETITDERYQFTKGEIKYETLLVVAGGSGGEDSSCKNRNSTGYDREKTNYNFFFFFFLKKMDSKKNHLIYFDFLFINLFNVIKINIIIRYSVC